MKKEIDKTIGSRIRERRTALKMTQTQLAELTGYTDKTAISKIENGLADLTQSKIVAFAEVLHTTPRYLMGWTEEPSQQELRLLAYYRALNPHQQDAVISILESMKGAGDVGQQK
jgi:transcriptional regulator with XRE-family HTH domain